MALRNILKITLAGSSKAGKSALMHSYTLNEFSEDYEPTVGVEFGMKEISIDDQPYSLQVWDTSGQERYNVVASSYFRESKAVLILYDTTKPDTFQSIQKHFDFVKSCSSENCIIALVGTHSEASIGMVPFSDAQAKARKLGIDENLCFEVSAKTGEGIHDMFAAIAQKILEKNNHLQAQANPPRKSRPGLVNGAPQAIRVPRAPEESELAIEEEKPNAFLSFLSQHKWAILTAFLIAAPIVAAAIVFWPVIVAAAPVITAAAAITALTMKIGFAVTATAFAATAISVVGAAFMTGFSWLVDVLTRPKLKLDLSDIINIDIEVPDLNPPVFGTDAGLHAAFNNDLNAAAAATQVTEGEDPLSRFASQAPYGSQQYLNVLGKNPGQPQYKALPGTQDQGQGYKKK